MPDLAPASLLMWWAFSLLSTVWQSSSARAPQASVEVSSSCWSLPLQASIHLWYCLPSLLFVPVGESFAVWPRAGGPLQTALGTSYLSPLQSPWYFAGFSLPPTAHLPDAGGPAPGQTFCRHICCLYLPQDKGLGTFHSLRSALQPLPSAAPSSWRHLPPLR